MGVGVFRDFVGAGMIQRALDNSNFIATEGDGLLFDPDLKDGTPLSGIAQHTYQPTESTNIFWQTISTKLISQKLDEGADVDFKVIVKLLGLDHDGNEILVGEKVKTLCDVVEQTDDFIFNLQKSACKSNIIPLDEVAGEGKVKLNLPMRASNFESLKMYNGTYDGWKRCKLIQIKGMSNSVTNQIANEVLINYDSDMNSDFSDLRFVDWDGTELDYYIMHKVNGSKALVLLKLPSSPSLNEIKYVKMYYKKSDAVSPVNPRNVFGYVDDYEDGKYTGRSSPYQNWVCAYGTASIISSGRISGTYSLKHTGPGGTYGVYYPGMEISNSLTKYIVDFDFKLAAQGSLASTPYITLWYLRISSGGNVGQYLRVDTYWSGSAQILRLTKREGTTDTTIATATLKSSKMAVGDTYHFTILDNGHYCNVVVNGNSLINTQYTSTLPQTIKGYGAQQDSQGIWDNINIGAWVYVLFEGVGTEKVEGYGGTWAYTEIIPDTFSDDDMFVNFTATVDPLNQIYFETKNWNRDPENTRIVSVDTAKRTVELGYDAASKFDMFRLRIEAIASSDYALRFTEHKYEYMY